jgi:glycosyltransferase involved in cell wall biosynthesis
MENCLFSIVVPCYQEQAFVFEHVKSLHKTLKKACPGVDLEIIAVNDGSTDDTLGEIIRAEKEVPGLRHISYAENQGKGYAVKSGMLSAQGDFVSYIDADGEISPEYLANYLAVMQQSTADIVIGSKKCLDSSLEARSFWRRSLSAGHQFVIKNVFRLTVGDTQVGCKVFRHNAVQDIFAGLQTKGFGFDLEVLKKAEKKGLTIKEQPIEIITRRQKSSVTSGALLSTIREICSIFLMRTKTEKIELVD